MPTRQDRPLMTLWTSGALPWVSRACMKSMLRAGHDLHLYSYQDVPNVPDGVTLRDAAEVVPEAEIFHFDGVRQPGRIGSLAPFSDLFRYRALSQGRGVWVDSDVYLMRPMTLSSATLLAWEEPQTDLPDGTTHRGYIGNAVMGMPGDSALVRDLVDLTSAPFPVPPWLSDDLLHDIRKKLAGQPFFPGAATYATVGPVALTYYAHENGVFGQVLPHHRFYAIPFRDVTRFGKADDEVRAGLPSGAEAVHLWSSVFRMTFDTAQPPGSFAARLREEALDG